VARFLAYRLNDALGPAPSDSPYIELSTATNTSLLGHCTHVSRIASSNKLDTALESRLTLLTNTTFYPVRRRSTPAFFSTSSLSLLYPHSPTVRSYLRCVFPRLRELATDLISRADPVSRAFSGEDDHIEFIKGVEGESMIERRASGESLLCGITGYWEASATGLYGCRGSGGVTSWRS
jgi:hypothetical protein